MARPVQRRFAIQVLKSAGESDPTQEAVSEATIDFYRQGATASETSTVTHGGESFAVPVYDSGGIKPGDTVSIEVGGLTFNVDAVPSRTLLMLSREPSPDGTIEEGKRLLPAEEWPELTDDSLGLAAGDPSPTTGDDGRLLGYVSTRRFDYNVHGSTLVGDHLTLDALGGITPMVPWLNARDFPTLQEAIDALPATGGVVYLPAGQYLAAPNRYGSGIEITGDYVTLRGDGIFSTRIVTPHPDFEGDFVTVKGKGCRIEDVSINGATGGGEGSCLVIDGTASDVSDCRLKNVLLHNALGHGLLCKDAPSLFAVDLAAVDNAMNGAQLERETGGPWRMTFIGGLLADNAGTGLEIIVADDPEAIDCGDSVRLLGGFIEGNRAGGATDGNGLKITRAAGVYASGCYFERRPSQSLPEHGEQFIYAEEVRGLVIDGCFFNGNSDLTPPPDVEVKRTALFVGCTDVRFTNNVGYRLSEELARFDTDCERVVECGNREIDIDLPRIASEGDVFGLSRGAVQLFHSDTVPSSTTDFEPGSVIWVSTQNRLYVLKSEADGWKSIKYTTD